MHKITNPDLDAKTGDCSICGIVKIRIRVYREKNTYQCMKRINNARTIWRANNKDAERQHRFTQRHKLKIKRGKVPSNCDICGMNSRRICYDHDHNTGEFRGWLCSGCNLALGLVKDNPHTLRKLASYIENRKPI